ncbi:FecR family protein [Chitinophaga alhagiae]|uniref:FecR family protein n=1 Tax=Chitinophaga alhagiae TaxID=2203219 RepID=UPI0018E54A94|nr:FecR family protein [Chitinophaga alhagiae]
MEQNEKYLDIAALIGKSLQGELTPEEAAALQAWVEESSENKALWERLTDPAYLQERVQYWEHDRDRSVHWRQLSEKISGKRPAGRVVAVRKALRYAAMLLPLLLLGGAALYFFWLRAPQGEETLASTELQIFPQGKVAQLILANGEKVNLNDSLQKAITEKDGTKVRNSASALSYVSGPAGAHVATLYNTLVTPRGGEYRIELSDGTKVWLNAASSLRYPTQFNGKERKVYLSGEAYFEVAKDAKQPFIVNTDRMDITVLGTKFNLSAYPDDPVHKTTLAEGSVRVNSGGGGVMLKPGYEAVIGKNNPAIQVSKVNVEAALAWKNGMFVFDSESLGSLMRKLSRWYNVEVKYDNGVDTLFHFTGRIRRYEDIKGILSLIELTGKVHFTFKDHELHVMK